MIAALAVILGAFLWLMKETNWLTIRLPAGETPKVKEPVAAQEVAEIIAADMRDFLDEVCGKPVNSPKRR